MIVLVPRAAASSDVFNAVAEPPRRAILKFLAAHERPVGDIVDALELAQPSVSKHLRVLRDAQLVREDREGGDGRQRVYRLTPGPLRDLSQWVESYRSFWPTNLLSLKRHLEGGKDPSR